MRVSHSRLVLALVSVVLVPLVLAGCGGLVDQDQPGRAPETITLAAAAPDAKLGQSFLARHGGLEAIEIWLDPSASQGGLLHLQITSEAAGGSVAVAESTLDLPANAASGFYRFAFTPLANSFRRNYRVSLQFLGASPVQAGMNAGAAYQDGSLTRDGQPYDAQLAFRLVYDPWFVLLEMIAAAGRALGLVAASIAQWLLPGWALLVLMLPATRRATLSFFEQIALAFPLGLAVYPVLMLWARTLGLSSQVLALLLPAISFVIILTCYRPRRWRWQSVRAAWQRGLQGGGVWFGMAAILLAGVIFMTRFFAVRGLDAPAWGDSVQHVAMTQLMLDHGGLFSAWEPYAPYTSLTVQFGFASNSAVLAWLLNLSSLDAVLLAGQAINTIAILALYPLAVRIARGNQWAGLLAMIAGGLLSRMPGFFVNWGRYAQLTGQAILPVAVWLLWEAAERERGRTARFVPLVAGAAVTLAGMALSYYRMPFYYAAFGLAWLLVYGIPRWRRDWRKWLLGVLPFGAVALVALLLMLPWARNLTGSSLSESVQATRENSSLLASVIADYAVWREIANYVSPVLLALALVGAVAGVLRHDAAIWLLIVWTGVMALLSAGRLIRLPGAGQLQSFTVLIMLYLPVSLLIGWLGSVILANAEGRTALARPLAFVLLLLIGALGVRQQLTMVNANYSLVTRPDMRAMTWLRANAPTGSRFLVEGYTVQNGASVVGSDAGWWLPLIAGRANTMPPQYTLLNEKPAEPGYNQAIVGLVSLLERAPLGAPETLSRLCQMGVTHIYLGQLQGLAGYGAKQLYSAAELDNQPAFVPVYAADRVRIYQLAPGVCAAS
jgi:hypothetical protein